MSAEIGDPAGSSATASKDSPLTPWGRRYFRLLDLCSIVFWLYVILKVFVFDFDTYLLQQLFPAHAWLLQLRLVFLLALLALALLVFDKSAVLLSCAYVVCFPLILVLWKIPRRIYKRQSWVLLFGLANAA